MKMRSIGSWNDVGDKIDVVNEDDKGSVEIKYEPDGSRYIKITGKTDGGDIVVLTDKDGTINDIQTTVDVRKKATP